MYHKRLLSTLLVLLACLCICNGAAVFPRSLTTQAGTVSDVSLSALRTRDQSGNQDTWNNYVEFYGSRTAYKGVFTFDVSDFTSVSSFSLDVNFKGPKKSEQEWTFEYFVPSSNSWVFAGDNANAASWVWTSLSFNGAQSFSDLVQANTVQVRLSAKRKGDDCDVDYLALNLVAGDAPSTPAPATPAPSTPAPSTPAPSTPAPSTPRPTAQPTTRPTSAPTTRPTNAPSTPKPTNAPSTPRPTNAPSTPRPTNAPSTPRPTNAPSTPRPTNAPSTPRPTNAPSTPRPTNAPSTPRPTNAPSTPKPTNAPSTPAPTTRPTNPPSTGGRICPAGQVWSPSPLTTWQWQLTGTIDQSLNVQMYDIDLFDATASLITSLHSRGRVVVCYFSTQYENWRPDASSFPAAALGNNLDDWPGERWADTRNAGLRSVMTARLDLAVSKGCDGVEPDNVDAYTNSNGLGLTAATQLDFNRFLASEAHKRGLSIGLKNDLDQVASLVTYFDWALNEQCSEYGECNYLTPFINAGKAVFGVDYEGSASSVCSARVANRMSWLMKDLDLGAGGTQCCTYAPGGCAAQANYRCVSVAAKRALYEEPVDEEIIADDVVIQEAQDATLVEADHSSSSFVAPVFALVVVSAIAMVL